eukprot:scaffold414077_cov37-Attheya_sp.AAC.1
MSRFDLSRFDFSCHLSPIEREKNDCLSSPLPEIEAPVDVNDESTVGLLYIGAHHVKGNWLNAHSVRAS